MKQTLFRINLNVFNIVRQKKKHLKNIVSYAKNFYEYNALTQILLFQSFSCKICFNMFISLYLVSKMVAIICSLLFFTLKTNGKIKSKKL